MSDRDPRTSTEPAAAPAGLAAWGGFNPRLWAGFIPNGFGQVKPDPFGEMARTAWENRDRLGYAWRILTQGVCDGCALGTAGMRDFTMPGVHLCTVRLNLLRLNTMGPLDPDALGDVASLRRRTGRELRRLGRLAHPMVRHRGEPGFRRVGWDEALDLAAARLAPVLARDPDRFATFVTSRGITNEVYYALQKATRLLGTNNVDNSARLCHAPSTVVLKQMLGATGSTCSYPDWIGADWLIFVGSDVANNQPVTMKYIYYAKQRGTKVALVNPYREPGMQRYWVPSALESAVFGTRIADTHFSLHSGGDAAFFTGALKALLESGGVDRTWVDAHTTGFEAAAENARQASWEELERLSGAGRPEMQRFARLVGGSERVVYVWSMGVTQHAHGSDNVRALVNLALARGHVGRDHTGLMPIRGHSGVQGGSEVGCVPTGLPGGTALDEAGRGRFEQLWGFAPPARPGLTAMGMLDAAHEGRLDAFYIVGGNFMDTLPDPGWVAAALEQVPLRIHQDLVVTSQMLLEPADTVLLFPARNRYEQTGGGTETSTERRILYSPQIEGARPGEARDEWQPLAGIVRRLRPDDARHVDYPDSQAIRDEIARAVPFYAGIETLRRTGDQVQYGGRHLCAGGRFGTADGRARFEVVKPWREEVPAGSFLLTTRRGKQFNSMVHRDRDPLTGFDRHDLLVAPEDAGRLGLEDGAAVRLRSAHGWFDGRLRHAPIRPGNVQGFWPEVNVLLPRDRRDADSDVPDYGAVVTLERREGGTP